MLWDESRQDKDMLAWYKRLLRLRKEIPAITRGETAAEQTRDEEGLIRITKALDGQKVTLLFHAGEGTVELPELSGKTELLTGQVFDGKVAGITALVLQ